MAIIVNPTSGRGRAGRALPAIRKRLTALGLSPVYRFTTQPGEAERLAREEIASGAQTVVCVGGDGTLHEIVNAILDAPPHEVTLGLLAFGTGNDFARGVGLFGDIDRSCNCLAGQNTMMVDVGVITSPTLAGPRYFLVAGGIGFTAETAKLINRGVRFLRGAPAYLWGALATLRRFNPVGASIGLDGAEPISRDFTLISISNVATTGGGMMIAPGADPTDGRFDVCIVGALGRLHTAMQLPKVFWGGHVRHPAVTMKRAKLVSIDTPEPMSLWVDGEIVGATPAQFRILPGILSVLAPQK